jgi:epoxyqueuosine reductase
VTDLEPFPDTRAELERRVASGESGRLGFTFKDPARSTDPRRSFPWGSSIVVVAVPYLRDGDGRRQGRRVARFADDDRYGVVRDLLDRLEAALQVTGARTEAVVDDDRLVDRAVAVRAGIAWWGKSTMALTPGLGPWFLIGSVVTDAALEPTAPMVRGCGSCTACIPACPTGAIVEPGVLDARRCLAAIFQSRGSIPIEFREAAGARVYGCDACLTACPPGDAALDRLLPSAQPDPRALLAMGDAELDAHVSHWYVPGRKMRFVRRNAIVAIGNDRRPEDVPLLEDLLGGEDALLRAHAVWALGRIGTDRALAALARHALHEADTEVREELDRVSAPATGPGGAESGSEPGGGAS